MIEISIWIMYTNYRIIIILKKKIINWLENKIKDISRLTKKFWLKVHRNFILWYMFRIYTIILWIIKLQHHCSTANSTTNANLTIKCKKATGFTCYATFTVTFVNVHGDYFLRYKPLEPIRLSLIRELYLNSTISVT